MKEATDDYLKKMKIMREELIELSKSCRELAEKIANGDELAKNTLLIPANCVNLLLRVTVAGFKNKLEQC